MVKKDQRSGAKIKRGLLIVERFIKNKRFFFIHEMFNHDKKSFRKDKSKLESNINLSYSIYSHISIFRYISSIL